MKKLNLILILLALSACATSKPVKNAPRNADRIGNIAVGTDKSEVLRTFGAPIKIEIDNMKFKYTYVQSRNSKVTIQFDDRNKVASIIK